MSLASDLEGKGLRLIWTDIETFGLNVMTDPILEIGFRITDLDLKTIDENDWIVWDDPTYEERLESLNAAARKGDKTALYVLKMHDSSGLWGQAQDYGLTVKNVEQEVTDFLKGHGVGSVDPPEPLCGSSVQFDRSMFDAHMPSISALFSYRNIDISTLKELCMRFNPNVMDWMEKNVVPKKKHRVLDDLTDTIDEFNAYKGSFLWVD